MGDKNVPAVSIIVPIYNMESLMRRCIDSILSQIFMDFELLLIDDGSEDASSLICDEYMNRDHRIRVFHKPNGGLSDARNYGIKEAQGMYCIFADPDDWVDVEGLDKLYEKARQTDADVVLCDIWTNDPYRQSYTKLKPSSMDSFLILQEMISGKIPSYTVNKLIRTSLYREYKISYPKGIYGCEDHYAMCSLFKHQLKVEYVSIAFYHYMFYGEASLSRKYDKNTYQIDLRIRDMLIKLLKDVSLSEMTYNYTTCYVVGRAFFYGNNVFSSEEFVKKFNSYKNIVLSFTTSSLLRLFLRVSLNGHYGLAWKMYRFLFLLKQQYKRIVYKQGY